MTDILAQEIARPYINETATPQLSSIVMTAVATGATHTFQVLTRGVMLIVENTHATTAETITIESTPDQFGRVANIAAFSIAAGTRVARFFLPSGWETTGGAGIVNFTVSATSLEIGLIAQ